MIEGDWNTSHSATYDNIKLAGQNNSIFEWYLWCLLPTSANKLSVQISKDGTNYYLINEKGKKVSKEYASISNYVDYYQVTNKDGDKGIINKKGDVIVDVKYTSVNIKEVRDTFYAVVSSSKGKYALYNLDSKKLVKESKNQITISDHYIKVTGDSKTSYYTYKDKLIFEE